MHRNITGTTRGHFELKAIPWTCSISSQKHLRIWHLFNFDQTIAKKIHISGFTPRHLRLTAVESCATAKYGKSAPVNQMSMFTFAARSFCSMTFAPNTCLESVGFNLLTHTRNQMTEKKDTLTIGGKKTKCWYCDWRTQISAVNSEPRERGSQRTLGLEASTTSWPGFHHKDLLNQKSWNRKACNLIPNKERRWNWSFQSGVGIMNAIIIIVTLNTRSSWVH